MNLVERYNTDAIAKRLRLIIALAAIVATMAMVSCSPKKNTAASRQYQAFITRYNIYYNGDTHFRETLKDMEDKYEDDYSRLVFMHPIEAKADPAAPQPAGNFDRSIEKAQKAIQLRSIKKKPKKKGGKSDAKYKAWLKREEYNPFLHNAWLMMGRSQYYNGDFLGASSTFFYISRHFTWLADVTTEAKLWQANSYIGLDWLYEAEMIITRIKPAELTNKSLRHLYNSVYADFWIKSGDYAKAIPYLTEAIKDSKGAQKTRQRFLLGQLYARIGEKQKAFEAFRKAGSASSASYRTKFNARIKQSEVYSGNDITPEVKALKRMTRYDRNKDYLDQIYYAIGNLYLSRQDTINAIANYKLAAEKSTRSGIDKAISQLTLGSLYYGLHNYADAQPCYSEAVPLLPKTYPDYNNIKRRSDVLDELAVYSQNVNLQDSLLKLSEMTPEQLEKVIKKIIDDLKKKEKEEAEAAKLEEYRANKAANENNMLNNQSSKPNTFNINTDDSWYFYNTASKNAGKTDFQRRWGSRKLEDHWRRRNKSSFSFDDFEADTETDEDSDTPTDSVASEMTKEEQEAADKASDPHNPEYYLAQIPTTDEQKATAHEVIQEGLYNMGVILKDKLDDYTGAYAEFSRLLNDYPDNVYRLDTYYNLYLMYMRLGDTATAETYRQLILTDFADSPYGKALTDPNYIDNLKAMDSNQQSLYDATYQAYLDNRNADVHQGYEKMQQLYPLSKIMPKFMFLNALAFATEREPEKFNEQLREMLERYPDTDITPIASAWLKGMAQGRQLQAGSSGANMRGMLWDLRLSNDTTAVGDREAAQFELNPADKQLLIMTFDTGVVSSNALLYEIARHNFRSFVVKDFDLEQMNFGRLGLIVIRDFANMDELNHYRKVMASAASGFKLTAGVRPIVISAKNFETLINEGRSFEEYFQYLEQQNYVDAQADILQPEEIETLQEADADTAVYEAEAEAAGGNDADATEPQPADTEPQSPAESEQPAADEQPAPGDSIKQQPAAPVTPTVSQPTEAKTDDTTKPAAPTKPTKPAAPTKPAKPATPTKPATPAKPTKPAPAQSNPLPTYAPGSEGDDDDLIN